MVASVAEGASWSLIQKDMVKEAFEKTESVSTGMLKRGNSMN